MRRLFAVVLSLIAVALTVVVITAQGANARLPAVTTMTFTAVQTQFAFLPNGAASNPMNPTPGSRAEVFGALKQNGVQVGGFAIDSQLWGKNRSICNGVAWIRGIANQVTFAGYNPGTSADVTFAVTGGTGARLGASGSWRMHTVTDTTWTITLTLTS